MSVFNPSALQDAPGVVLDTFFNASPAPAVLMEISRGGLSVTDVRGTVDVETGEAATIDNHFQVGSQTKMMTSVVVLNLVAQGLIDFDAPLSDQIDTSDLAEIANVETVTVRQLLANRSGIPDFDTVPGTSGQPVFIEKLMAAPDQPLGPDEMLAIASGQQANFAPGTAYEYSNTNFLLLQKLVENVTGQDFGQALSDLVFTPAGMKDSSFGPHNGSGTMLHSYTDLGLGQDIDVTHIPFDTGAAGGVVSTTSDMIRFLDALVVSNTLLPPEQWAEIMDFRAPDGTAGVDGESLGLSSGTIFGQQFVGFQGGTLGTNTATFVHIESGTIVSVAATHSGAEPVDLFVAAFEAIFNDGHWASFDPDDSSFEIAGSAADITLSEETDVSGEIGTVLELGAASLTLSGRLADLDTDSLTFSDGSILWAGDGGRDWFDVLCHAREAAHADNQLQGLNGNDYLRGGFGDDKIIGGAGHDDLQGRSGDDILDGGSGRDRLMGGDGDDHLLGGDGRDLLRGGHGEDHLEGGTSGDRLSGGAGDDVLSGGSGADILYGGRGDDILDGGSGQDRMWGGRGADVFVFQENAGDDKIYGFNPDEDLLDFTASGFRYDQLEIEKGRAGHVHISYGDNELDIIGISVADLTEDNFVF